MADARWSVLERYRDATTANLALAIPIWDGRDWTKAEGDLATEEKVFQKALQDAYSTFEQAALYILKISDEIRPDGERWHEQLLLTVTAASGSRPAFAPHLWKPLQQLRRFRHVAMDAYLDFEMRQADHTVEAARRLLAKLPPAFDAFGRAFGLLMPQPE